MSSSYHSRISQTGEPSMSQRFEWTWASVIAQIDNPWLQDIPFEPQYARWLRILGAGILLCMVVRTFPESELLHCWKSRISSPSVLCPDHARWRGLGVRGV